MKLGDLIKRVSSVPTENNTLLGVVIDVQDKYVIPPVMTIMWETGEIEKIYSDELEAVSESR
tara:strand:- start:173 stop:358 length:186 start_codon:yes stop_codon:yes gene_type:complete